MSIYLYIFLTHSGSCAKVIRQGTLDSSSTNHPVTRYTLSLHVQLIFHRFVAYKTSFLFTPITRFVRQIRDSWGVSSQNLNVWFLYIFTPNTEYDTHNLVSSFPRRENGKFFIPIPTRRYAYVNLFYSSLRINSLLPFTPHSGKKCTCTGYTLRFTNPATTRRAYEILKVEEYSGHVGLALIPQFWVLISSALAFLIRPAFSAAFTNINFLFFNVPLRIYELGVVLHHHETMKRNDRFSSWKYYYLIVAVQYVDIFPILHLRFYILRQNCLSVFLSRLTYWSTICIIEFPQGCVCT